MKGVAGLVDAFLGLRSSVFLHERTERTTPSGSSGRSTLPTDFAGVWPTTYVSEIVH